MVAVKTPVESTGAPTEDPQETAESTVVLRVTNRSSYTIQDSNGDILVISPNGTPVPASDVDYIKQMGASQGVDLTEE